MRQWIANKLRNMADRVEPYVDVYGDGIEYTVEGPYWTETMLLPEWGASGIDKEEQETKSKAMRDTVDRLVKP